MKKRLLDFAKREYTPRQRLVALAVEAPFFGIVIPVVLVYLSSLLDARLGLPPLTYGVAGRLIGGLLMMAGALFAGWAIYAQFTIGRGTPSPVMATQKLVVQGPYAYCRNPMALGATTFYLGVALAIASLGALGLVAMGTVVHLAYIKLVEEKELELRFGEAYREYRERTPFLIPRLRRKG